MAPQAFKRLHTHGRKPETAREWVAKVIDNHWVETFIMLLVVGDLLFVAVEAGIDAHLLCISGEVVTRESAPSSIGHLMLLRKAPRIRGVGRQHQHLLATDLRGAAALMLNDPHDPHEPHGSHADGSEAAASVRAEPAWHPADIPEGSGHAEVLECDTSEGHHAKHVMHVCHVCSIAILCVFMVELLLKWWANPAEFLAGWCHKLDLFVVTVSLIIDTVVMTYIEHQHENAERQRMEREGVQLVAFLLILSRSWRIVRICHGFFEQYHHFQEEAEKPREENAVFRKVLLKLGKDPDQELESSEREQGAAKVARH